jgi:signal peptide peptidase SppA
MSDLSLYIARHVFNEPWIISSAAMDTIVQVASSKISGEKYTREGIGECGEAVEMEGMEIDSGIARIPVSGVIVKDPDFLIRGMVNVSQLSDEFEEADLRDDVDEIHLILDTPGGMVSGVPEFASQIFQSDKPTKAIVKGQACSAGYWIASACDSITMSGMSCESGSIGVIVALADYSKYYEEMGVKMEVFTSGDLKGLGMPGTSLSDSQREHLQTRVQNIFDMFKTHVEMMRGELDPEVFRGQSFMANDSLKYNLVDLVKTQ